MTGLEQVTLHNFLILTGRGEADPVALPVVPDERADRHVELGGGHGVQDQRPHRGDELRQRGQREDSGEGQEIAGYHKFRWIETWGCRRVNISIQASERVELLESSRIRGDDMEIKKHKQ